MATGCSPKRRTPTRDDQPLWGLARGPSSRRGALVTALEVQVAQLRLRLVEQAALASAYHRRHLRVGLQVVSVALEVQPAQLSLGLAQKVALAEEDFVVPPAQRLT